MKLCIILPPGYFPYPLHSGGAQAVFQMIDALRSKMEVSVMFAYKKREAAFVQELKDLWTNVQFLGFENNWTHSISHPAWLLSQLGKKIFKANQMNWLDTRYGQTPLPFAYSAFIEKVLGQNDFDIVQTEFFPALQYAYFLPKNIKKVFVCHEIRFVLNERYLQQEKSGRFYADFLANQTKAMEIATLNQYDVVVTLTGNDQVVLENVGVKTPVLASPAIVASDKEMPATYEFANKISFLASAANLPNREGLDWFLENCWERILEKATHLKLQVIGAWPREACVSIQNKYRNVEFLGYVDDLQSALAGSIMIVSLLSGSGMRIKIMDAVNHGCPVITTSVGIEGLEFRDEVDCIIEDEADLFAEKLCDLAQNEAKQKQLRASAKEMMERLYSKEVLAQKRMDAYKYLLEKKE
jgi:glycosyltransferase involved in cell wall biosynthesis